MACSIAFTTVNGIVQLGQTDPSVLRVTGVATECTSGQVMVSSPIASSQTVPVVNGRFRAELTITATPAPHCGDLITVRAECVGQATCFVQEQQRQLTCCEIPMLYFQAVTPLGSLLPSQLSVRGTIHGCATDQIVISSPITATTGPIAVDPYTGEFSESLPITSAVQCDDRVAVTVACSSGVGCTRTVEVALDCPICYRGAVTVDATAACTGMPLKKPITLNVTIGLPAGRKERFHWDYGDGSPIGTQFTIDNTLGTAGATYPHSEAHDYAPGTYTATLKIDPPREACPDLTVTIVAQCTTTGCPTIVVDPPQVSGQCVNGKRTITLTSHITAPAGQGVFAQWDYGDGTVGPGIVVNAASTLTNTQTHDYAPGTYTASLNILSPTGCPPVPPVQVVVPPCTPPTCTLVVTGIAVQVGACDPVTGMRTVTATGSVNNNDPADRYYWQWDANPALIGLPAATGTTQLHPYAAPGSGQTTYTITLMVMRSSTCVSTATKTVPIDGCGAGCPEIISTLIDSPGVCTPDRLRRKVTLDATVSGSGVTQYVWTFGDGTTLTLPGSAGPQTTHEYAPGTYTVNLKAVGPGSCESNFPSQIVIDPCCPQVTDINIAPGTCPAGATSRPVTLSAQVAGTGMSSYDWDFGDGSPAATSTTPIAPTHNYAAPGSFTAVVTVHTPNCPDVWASKSVSVAACTKSPNGGSGLPSCAALLWAAIFFMLIGAIVSVVGCILSHFFPPAGLIVGIIGIVIFAIGVILFLIWWIICRLFTACAVILAVRAFVMVLIAVFAVIAIIIGIVAIFTPAFWPCAAAATVYGFAWGGILAMLDWLAQNRGCIILNPAGGAPSASSSSGLTSSGGLTSAGGSTRLRASDFSQMTTQVPAGLGDVVKSMTSAIGIQPCATCHERAERLNARFPFGTAPKPSVGPR
jgi:PKD repeat protein